MAPRLKVFTWSDGFHAFSVATTSRPKALKAWGSNQDLFATGLASQLSGGPDYDAALKSPGDVIERGLTIDIGKISKAHEPRKTKGPTAAQREKVRSLTADLEALGAAHDETINRLEQAAAAIQRERAAAEKAHDRRRRKLTKALKDARAKLGAGA